MRGYGLAWLIGLTGAGMLVAAAVIAQRTEPAPAAVHGGRGGQVWGEDWFPDVPLITHDGERVRFFDLIEDRVVAINFVYTTCPDTCPMETARLLQVAELLGDRLGRDVFFYSITIDPATDTQPVLRAFADAWDVPEGWKFLTGDARDLVLLREKLGVRIEDVRSRNPSDHDVNLVIGNQRTGRWMKRSPFENSYVLADQLGSWLHDWKPARAQKRDYADAPELRSISSGEDLYRTRCAACHTIGGGDLLEVARRRVGPDLYDVGRRRDRAWLERWLAEPDVMLEEKDPLATALLAQYRNIPMPNLRLSERDVTAILGYIDQESGRVARLRAAAAAGHDDHTGHTGHTGHEEIGEAAARSAVRRSTGDGAHAEGR